MKSIITRYSQIKEKGFNEEDATNINMVTKALKSAGIVADDGTGQLKNFSNVIDELGGKWGTLDAKTRSYIATQMAGIYQGNRFKALMNDYSRSLELYEGSLNSAGVANQKFAIYQESSAAKADKLKASMEGFWQKSFNSESFKLLLEGLTILINSFSNLTQVLSFAVGIILVWKTGILGAIPSLLGFATAADVLAVSAGTATVALTTMQIALGVFGLIAIAVGVAITVFDYFNESATETAQKIADINNEVQKLDGNLESVKRLAKEFENLNEKMSMSKLSTEELEKLKDIQNELAETMPSIVDSYDAEGNAIIKNTKLLDEEIKKLKEERNLKLSANTDSYVKQLEKENEARDDLIKVINIQAETLKRVKGMSQQQVLSSDYEIYGAGEKKRQEWIKRTEKELEKLSLSLNESGESTKNLYKNILSTIPAFEKLEGSSRRMGEVLAESSFKGEFGGKINFANIDLFKQRIGEIGKKLEENNIPEKIKQYDELSLSYQQGNGDLATVIENYNSLKSELVGIGLSYEQIDKFLKSIEETKAGAMAYSLSNAIKDLKENTSDLSKAYDEMNQNGSITLDTMEELLKKHPELQKDIKIENGLITISTKLLSDKYGLEKTMNLEQLEAYKKSLEAKKIETAGKIALYRTELAALALMAKAFAGINKIKPLMGLDVKAKPDIDYKKELKDTEDNLKDVQDSIDKINNLTIEGSKKDKMETDRAEVKSNEKLLETELYSDVNNEIAKYNSLINESEGIVKNTKNLSEQNMQLEKQRELYEGLQKAIHAKAEVARQEQKDLVTDMSKMGFDFSRPSNYGKGNIDLNNRPMVKNDDGSISTVRSLGIEDENGVNVLIPTVRKGLDRIMSNEEAIQHYFKSGEFLGKFKTQEESDIYAESLHKDQEKYYNNPNINDDLKISNSAKIIADQKEKTDKLKDYKTDAGRDEYTKEKEKYQEMQNLDKRFYDIQNVELYGYKNNFTDVGDKIVSDINKLNSNKIDISFEQPLSSIKYFDSSIKGLDEKFKLLKENDFSGKNENLSKQIEKSTKYINEQKDSLKKLNETTDEASRYSDDYIKSELLIEESVKNATISIAEANKAREALAKSAIQADIDKRKEILDLEQTKNQRDDQLKEREFEDREASIKTQENLLEQQIFGGKESDYEDQINNRIKLLQDQSDEMQKQEDSLAKQEALNQKLLDLEKAKQELANLQNEKNARLYTGKGFEWVANPKDIASAQEKVSSLQEDYNKIQQDQVKEQAKQEIKDEIDSNKNMLDENKKAYDKRAKILEDSLADDKTAYEQNKRARDRIIQDENLSLEAENKNVADKLKTLHETYNQSWTSIIDDYSGKVASAEILAKRMRDALAAQYSVGVVGTPAPIAKQITASDIVAPSSLPSKSTPDSVGVVGTPAPIAKQITASDIVAPSSLPSKSTPDWTAPKYNPVTEFPTVTMYSGDVSGGASPSQTVTMYSGDVSGGASPSQLASLVAHGDTGLYTGNKEGLIYAHEKELLLNPEDTKNILNVAYANRNIASNKPNMVSNSSVTKSDTIYNLNNVKIVSENAEQLWKNIEGYAVKRRQ